MESDNRKGSQPKTSKVMISAENHAGLVQAAAERGTTVEVLVTEALDHFVQQYESGGV